MVGDPHTRALGIQVRPILSRMGLRSADSARSLPPLVRPRAPHLPEHPRPVPLPPAARPGPTCSASSALTASPGPARCASGPSAAGGLEKHSWHSCRTASLDGAWRGAKRGRSAAARQRRPLPPRPGPAHLQQDLQRREIPVPQRRHLGAVSAAALRPPPSRGPHRGGVGHWDRDWDRDTDTDTDSVCGAVPAAPLGAFPTLSAKLP